MQSKYLIVDSEVLPEVFLKVVKAKELLALGEVKNLSAAAKVVDISRSALYKYKDKVFDASQTKTVMAVHVVLVDKLGALQRLISVLAKYKISIITITQSAPLDGTAAVSLTIKVGDMLTDINTVMQELNDDEFIVSAKRILHEI